MFQHCKHEQHPPNNTIDRMGDGLQNTIIVVPRPRTSLYHFSFLIGRNNNSSNQRTIVTTTAAASRVSGQWTANMANSSKVLSDRKVISGHSYQLPKTAKSRVWRKKQPNGSCYHWLLVLVLLLLLHLLSQYGQFGLDFS